MYTNHEHKLVFLHNPRTAGKSIVTALKGIFNDTRQGYIRHDCIYEWPGYECLTVLRNPWDQVRSMYNFYKTVSIKAILTSFHKEGSINEIKEDFLWSREDLDRFVLFYEKYIPSQDDFLFNSSNHLVFENLRVGWENFCKQRDYQYESLEETHKSEQIKDEEFSPKSLNLIYERNRFSINLLNYTP